MPDVFDDPVAIVAELSAAAATHDTLLRNATPTMRMFRENGVFEDPVVSQAFHRAGLFPQRFLAGRPG
jgi:hypothetical protein